MIRRQSLAHLLRRTSLALALGAATLLGAHVALAECASGQVACGGGCMPSGAVCCGTSGYCDSGEKCCSNGCAPSNGSCCGNGYCDPRETCSGGSCSTPGGSSSGGCGSGEKACGNGCIDSDSVCCSTYSCPSGASCASGGKCSSGGTGTGTGTGTGSGQSAPPVTGKSCNSLKYTGTCSDAEACCGTVSGSSSTIACYYTANGRTFNCEGQGKCDSAAKSLVDYCTGSSSSGSGSSSSYSSPSSSESDDPFGCSTTAPRPRGEGGSHLPLSVALGALAVAGVLRRRRRVAAWAGIVAVGSLAVCASACGEQETAAEASPVEREVAAMATLARAAATDARSPALRAIVTTEGTPLRARGGFRAPKQDLAQSACD